MVKIGFGDIGFFTGQLAGQAVAQIIVGHQHAADLAITFRLMLPNPAQQRHRVAGPQRLPGLRIQRLRHALFLPFLHQRQCALVRRQHGITQWLPLLIQQKRPFALRRDADGLNITDSNLVAGQQLADHLGSGVP
ncbi:hypothetical protein D3C73_1125600 [compost metagenome]